MYKFNGFTIKANNAINYAIITAEQLGHTYVGSEHLLLGLLREGTGVAAAILSQKGVVYEQVNQSVVQNMGRGVLSVLSPGDFSSHLKKILEDSAAECRAMGLILAGTEHVLLALVTQQGCFAMRYLATVGLDRNTVGRMISEAIATEPQEDRSRRMPPPPPPRAQKGPPPRTATLDKYGRDLTELALAGRLDPVIGREREIERVIQILTRRTKNNPCLIGETGVGKTAIVEGLAQRIANGTVPESLQGDRIISVDLTAMVSGTKYRGDFEERIRSMMEEVAISGNIILFIDEIHTIMGVGAAEGAVDAANMMKPQLARGGFQVVGATTTDEYRKTIERDGALERRFQSVLVEEPSPADAITIIKGLRDRYEQHHQLNITDEAIEAAVELSRRYDTGRFLPDKAIDLIDEAASRMRLHAPTGKKRDLFLGREDIALIIAQSTGIDMSRITEEEQKRYLRLEEQVKERLIGQDEAVSKVCRAIRRSRAGLKDPARPIGCFLFVGPTGVGKTQLCRVLAELLFGDKESIIKLDMSEYTERHSISRLIGSPPGYLGYDDGGQLTEKIRRKPYSIVLFDEMEKAHPDVYNILLQIMEDGELTDSRGKKAVFRNAIIIMTSNAGAASLQGKASMGFTVAEGQLAACRGRVMAQVKECFKPEFLNRLDEIVMFGPLGKKELVTIAEMELAKVQQRLEGMSI
ncbi:MAG: ATP-dependent Clp protease ATP-binding subunit, partial [Angelakisella sp.]